MIVGVTGRKFHGKDSVARELVARGFTMMRFAGPLKAMLTAFYREHGIDDLVIFRKLEGDLKETPCPLLRGKTPRHAMQTLGTEWGRDCISDDLWVESLKYRLEDSQLDIVVPDVRFANEAAVVSNLGGQVWRVAAPRRVPAQDSHASEADVDALRVDKEINNDGGLFELKHAVAVALNPAREAVGA